MKARKEDWHGIFIVVKGTGSRLRVDLHGQGLAWTESLTDAKEKSTQVFLSPCPDEGLKGRREVKNFFSSPTSTLLWPHFLLIKPYSLKHPLH